ncbi:hypothetical protein IAT38_004076 [Cryptococcus sp. DSM 104549]
MLSQILQRVISLLASGVAGVYHTFNKRPATIHGTTTQDISAASDTAPSPFEDSAIGQACDHVVNTTLTPLVNVLDTAERKVVNGVKRATYLVFGVCSGYFVLRFSYRQLRRLVSGPVNVTEDNQIPRIDETSPLINGESASDDLDATSPSYGATAVIETPESLVPEVPPPPPPPSLPPSLSSPLPFHTYTLSKAEPSIESSVTAQEVSAGAPESDDLTADLSVVVDVQPVQTEGDLDASLTAVEENTELAVPETATPDIEYPVIAENASVPAPETDGMAAEIPATVEAEQPVNLPDAAETEQPVGQPAAVEETPEELPVAETAKPDIEPSIASITAEEEAPAPVSKADSLDAGLPVSSNAEKPVVLPVAVKEVSEPLASDVAKLHVDPPVTTHEVAAHVAVEAEQPVELPAAVDETAELPVPEVAKRDINFTTQQEITIQQEIPALAPDTGNVPADLPSATVEAERPIDLPASTEAEKPVELPASVEAKQPVETQSVVSDGHSTRDVSAVPTMTTPSRDQVENVQAPKVTADDSAVAHDAQQVTDSAIDEAPVRPAREDPFGPPLPNQANIFFAAGKAAHGTGATSQNGPSYPTLGNDHPSSDPYGMYGTPTRSSPPSSSSPPPPPRPARVTVSPNLLQTLSSIGLRLDLENGTIDKDQLEYASAYLEGHTKGYSAGSGAGYRDGYRKGSGVSASMYESGRRAGVNAVGAQLGMCGHVLCCQVMAYTINNRIGKWLIESPEGYNPDDADCRGLPQDIRDSVRALIKYNEHAAIHNPNYSQLGLKFKVTENEFILTMRYGDAINTIKTVVHCEDHRPFKKFRAHSGSGSFVQLLDTQPTTRQSAKKLNLPPVKVPNQFFPVGDFSSQYMAWIKNTMMLAASHEGTWRDKVLCKDREALSRLSVVCKHLYLQALQDGYDFMSQDGDQCWFTVGKLVPFPKESLATQWAARTSVCGHMVDSSVANFPAARAVLFDHDLRMFASKLDEAAFELEKAFLTSPWCIENENDAVQVVPATVLEQLGKLQLEAFKMECQLRVTYRHCTYWILIARTDPGKISRVEGAKVQVYYPGIPDSTHIYPVAKPSVPAPKVTAPSQVEVVKDGSAVKKSDEPEDVIKGLAGDLSTEVTDSPLSVISNASPASDTATVVFSTDEQAPLKLDTAVVAIPKPENVETKVLEQEQEKTMLAENQADGATVVDVKEGEVAAGAIHKDVKVDASDVCVSVTEVASGSSRAASPTQSLPSSEPRDVAPAALPTGLDAPAPETVQQSGAPVMEPVTAPVEVEGVKSAEEVEGAELDDVDDALRISSEAAPVKPTAVADEETSKAQREAADAQAAAKRASKKKKKEKKQVNIKKSAAKRAAAAGNNDASPPQQHAGPSSAGPSSLSSPPAAPSSSKPSSPAAPSAIPTSVPSASTPSVAVAHSPSSGSDPHSATELSQPEMVAVLAPGKPLETVEAVPVEKVEISQVPGTAATGSSKQPAEAPPSTPPLSWAARAIAELSSKTTSARRAAHPRKGSSSTSSTPLPKRGSTPGRLPTEAELAAAEQASKKRMDKVMADFYSQARWPANGPVGTSTPNASASPNGSPAVAAKGAACASPSFSFAPYDRPMRGGKAASEAIMEKMKANMSSTFAGGVWQKKE